jgi:hypothetical protein
MKDPHVEKLRYKIITGEGFNYESAPAFSEETNYFRMFLDKKNIIFEMKVHFSTEKEARIIADEYLMSWEVLIGIQHNPNALSLKFDRADIIDRDPSPNSEHPQVQATATIAGHVNPLKSYNEYPSRPRRFRASPDVETMYSRYKAYKQKRESLTSMAYFCLTVLEYGAGNRKIAAVRYNIKYEVLKKLGELCSEKGNKKEARKASRGKNYVPLTPLERRWIEEVIKALIQRVGEWAYDSQAKFKQITMHDFPSLAEAVNG